MSPWPLVWLGYQDENLITPAFHLRPYVPDGLTAFRVQGTLNWSASLRTREAGFAEVEQRLEPEAVLERPLSTVAAHVLSTLATAWTISID